jgi:hypothetical protein
MIKGLIIVLHKFVVLTVFLIKYVVTTLSLYSRIAWIFLLLRILKTLQVILVYFTFIKNGYSKSR